VVKHPNGVHSKRYTEKSMEKIEELEEKTKTAPTAVVAHLFCPLWLPFSNEKMDGDPEETLETDRLFSSSVPLFFNSSCFNFL
jgi:hypothetical protein